LGILENPLPAGSGRLYRLFNKNKFSQLYISGCHDFMISIFLVKYKIAQWSISIDPAAGFGYRIVPKQMGKCSHIRSSPPKQENLKNHLSKYLQINSCLWGAYTMIRCTRFVREIRVFHPVLWLDGKPMSSFPVKRLNIFASEGKMHEHGETIKLVWFRP